MPEETSTTTTAAPVPTPPPTATAPAVTPAQGTDEPIEIKNDDGSIDWKAAARKWEREAGKAISQVRELQPQADQFKALEEASKSEVQRLAEAAETAKRDAETSRAEAIRYRVAATHGIPAEDFDLLGSGTEEEISARAERIAAKNAAQAAATATTPAPPGRPVEQLRPGATPGGTESEDDVILAKLFGPPST